MAFQAALRGGGAGAFTDRGVVSTLDVLSHPDINSRGDICFFAREGGASGVYLVSGGHARRIAADPGPLGPTMNQAGLVAWRGTSGGGREAIYLGGTAPTTLVAVAGDGIIGFQGLPVVNAAGEVAYRADLEDGGQAICRWSPAGPRTVVRTGGEFGSISRFPSMNDAGEVAFCGLRRGSEGVHVAGSRGIETVLEAGDRFESLRGALIDNAGRLLVIGTPRGGSLGVLVGGVRGVTGVGSPLLGSEIAEFALNPVSMNNRGRIALRVRLRDGRECVLRVDVDDDTR